MLPVKTPDRPITKHLYSAKDACVSDSIEHEKQSSVMRSAYGALLPEHTGCTSLSGQYHRLCSARELEVLWGEQGIVQADEQYRRRRNERVRK